MRQGHSNTCHKFTQFILFRKEFAVFILINGVFRYIERVMQFKSSLDLTNLQNHSKPYKML